jgi:hypothetical protein
MGPVRRPASPAAPDDVPGPGPASAWSRADRPSGRLSSGRTVMRGQRGGSRGRPVPEHGSGRRGERGCPEPPADPGRGEPVGGGAFLPGPAELLGNRPGEPEPGVSDDPGPAVRRLGSTELRRGPAQGLPPDQRALARRGEDTVSSEGAGGFCRRCSPGSCHAGCAPPSDRLRGLLRRPAQCPLSRSTSMSPRPADPTSPIPTPPGNTRNCCGTSTPGGVSTPSPRHLPGR